MIMKITYSNFSDKGGRAVNEDYTGVAGFGDRYCFVLCDGLGGHGMGDMASRFTVKYIKERFIASADSAAFVSGIADDAHLALKQEQEKDIRCSKMRTTAVVLVIDGGMGYSVHIGDSRLYVFRDDMVIFRTKDHSIPQMLVLTGEIKEDEIRRHPDRSCLLHALGDETDNVRYEKSEFDLMPGDCFLLCSDGFWEPVTEEEMCSELRKSRSAEEWLSAMSKKAAENSRGMNMDNFSAVAVFYGR